MSIDRATIVDQSDVPLLAVDPFGHDFLSDPYAFHDQLREAGPLFRLERYGIYGMARHAEVAAALADWQRFSSARGVGLADFAHEPPGRPPSLLLEADPPDHDRARKIVTSIISPGALRDIKPAWRDKAAELVDELVARRRFDAVKDLAEIFPLSILPDTLGMRSDGRENLLPYAAAVFNGFGPRNAIRAETDQAAAASIAWVTAACRRENLSPGGWGMAVHEHADAGDCTPQEAELLVRSFLSAGFDTTVNGIGNMLHAFARHPAEWDRLRANPSFLKRAFEESLRWDSTVQTFFRTTTCAVSIGDAVIPEGAKVLLFLAAANRDPRRWTTPDQFDIARATSGHVGFGFGLHQCVGQMIARQEAELVLEALIPRVAAIRVAGPIERRLNNTLHALASLPVEIEPA